MFEFYVIIVFIKVFLPIDISGFGRVELLVIVQATEVQFRTDWFIESVGSAPLVG